MFLHPLLPLQPRLHPAEVVGGLPSAFPTFVLRGLRRLVEIQVVIEG